MTIDSSKGNRDSHSLPRVLEPHIDWRAKDVSDPSRWTVRLDDNDHRELNEALIHAKSVSHDLLEIDRGSFPLPTLSAKLAEIERELIDGRGFVLISRLPAERYSDDDLALLYWGIGLHLGDPWPQNKAGLLMSDVTDQGGRRGDPTSRGNEIGHVGMKYHSDGSDLVGLLCLRKAKRGGLSCVANAVAIHNELVRTRPDMVAVLSEPLPFDLLGRQPASAPVTTCARFSATTTIACLFTSSVATSSRRSAIVSRHGFRRLRSKRSTLSARWRATPTSTSI